MEKTPVRPGAPMTIPIPKQRPRIAVPGGEGNQAVALIDPKRYGLLGHKVKIGPMAWAGCVVDYRNGDPPEGHGDQDQRTAQLLKAIRQAVRGAERERLAHRPGRTMRAAIVVYGRNGGDHRVHYLRVEVPDQADQEVEVDYEPGGAIA